MAKVVDPSTVVPRESTIYPKEFAGALKGRQKRALTELLGLTQFGVNVTTLQPGAASSQRHWHVSEDECCYVLEGEVTLITNEGEQTLTAGMAMGFPANDENGHQLINRGSRPATYLEIGTRAQVDRCLYPDIDMLATKTGGKFTLSRKNGQRFE